MTETIPTLAQETTPAETDPLEEFNHQLARWNTRTDADAYNPDGFQASARSAVAALGILPEEAFPENEVRIAARGGVEPTDFMMGRAADVVSEAAQAGFDLTASREDQRKAALGIVQGYKEFTRHTTIDTGEPPEGMSSEEYERQRKAKELLATGTARLLGYAPAGEIRATRAHELAGALGARVVANQTGVVLAPGDRQ